MILYFLVFVGGTLTKLLLRVHWLVLGTEYRTNGLFRTKFGTILSPGCRWFYHSIRVLAQFISLTILHVFDST